MDRRYTTGALLCAGWLLLMAGCGGAAQSGNSSGSKLTSEGVSKSASTAAVSGKTIFADTCASCHGKTGQGISGPRLAAPSPITTQYPTPAQLETFIAHNMPANNPGSLTSQQSKNVTTYVWKMAGGK